MYDQNMIERLKFQTVAELLPEEMRKSAITLESEYRMLLIQQLSIENEKPTPDWNHLKTLFSSLTYMIVDIRSDFSQDEKMLIWNSVFRTVFECHKINCINSAITLFISVFKKKVNGFSIKIPMKQLVELFLSCSGSPSLFSVYQDPRTVMNHCYTVSILTSILKFYKTLRLYITCSQYDEILSLLMPSFPFSNTLMLYASCLLFLLYPKNYYNEEFTNTIMNLYTEQVSTIGVYCIPLLLRFLQNEQCAIQWESYFPLVLQSIQLLIIDESMSKTLRKAIAPLLTLLMTVGKRKDGIPEGTEKVLELLRMFYPLIQPGNSRDSQEIKATMSFLNSVFKSTYLCIRKEVEDWMKQKKRSFSFINCENETDLLGTPIIKKVLSFYLEFYYYSIRNQELVGEAYITHIVEFYPKDVFTMIMDVYEEIRKDDTFEGTLLRLFEMTYYSVEYFCQSYAQNTPTSLVPKGDDIDLLFGKLCEFLFSICTQTLLTDPTISNRFISMTIIQQLFRHTCALQHLSIISRQDQLDVWASEVFPSLVKMCCLYSITILIPMVLDNNYYAFSRICSMISADVMDYIVKECVSVICETIEADTDLQFLNTVIHFLPVSSQCQTLIIHKLENIIDTYVTPSTGSLSFEVVDRVFDENRYQRDLVCCRVLMRFLPVSYHQSFFEKYQQTLLSLLMSPRYDVVAATTAFINAISIESNNGFYDFSILPDCYCDIQYVQKVLANYKQVTYSMDTMYWYIYKPLYEELLRGLQTPISTPMSNLFHALSEMEGTFFYTGATSITPRGLISHYLSPEVTEDLHMHTLDRIYVACLQKVTEDDSLVNNCFFSYLMSNITSYFANSQPAACPYSFDWADGISMSKYLSIACSDTHDMGQYNAVFLVMLADSLENGTSMLFNSVTQVQYVESEEHTQCIDSILAKLFYNNRTIQLLALNLFTENVPYQVQLHSLLKIMDCMKQLYQQESLAPVQSYALRIMSSCLSVAFKSPTHIFTDPQLLQVVFDIIDLSEEKAIQTVDDKSATEDAISNMMNSIIVYFDCIVFIPELVTMLTSHFFSVSSWVKKSFYLSLLTEAAIQLIEIPQIDAILQSVFLSFNSVMYKVSMRLISMYVANVCSILGKLTSEDQTRVLHFLLRYSLTNVYDAVTTNKNKQDTYSDDIKQMLSLVLSVSTSISLTPLPSIQQTISNIGRYHVWVFRELCKRDDWALCLLKEVGELVKAPDEDERKSYNIVVSSLFAAILVTRDFTAEPVIWEGLCEMLAILLSQNVNWICYSLLYTLVYLTQKEDYPRLFANCNAIIQLLSSHSNKLVVEFAQNLLLFVFIHDYSISIHSLCPCACAKDDGIQCIQLVNIDLIVDLIKQSHDLMTTILKVSLPHLLLLLTKDPQRILPLYQAKYELMTQQPTNLVVIMDYISTITTLSTIYPPYVISILGKETYLDLLTQHFFIELQSTASTLPLVSKTCSQYLQQNIANHRYPVEVISHILCQLGTFLQSVDSIQSLMDMITLACFLYTGYFRILSKQAKNSFFNTLLMLLEHPNSSVRNHVQGILSLLWNYYKMDFNWAVYRKYKAILENVTTPTVKKESAVRVLCSLILIRNYVLQPLTKEIVLYLIHYESRDETIMNIIFETFTQFRKHFIKRLDYLKKQFDEDDWEWINTNNTYISYILYPVE